MTNLENSGGKKRWVLFLVVLIVLPIVFQQVKSNIGAKMQEAARKAPKTVQVTVPEVKEIYTQSSSAGRVSAKYSVDVLARINGWLEKRYFEEGAPVKKGQTLFLIEPNQYQNAVNSARANVRQTKAVFVDAEKDLARAQELVKQDYVSKSYYDDALAARDRSQAAYDAAKAQLADAELNLSYTKVTSPIDGKIGKIIITEGNLVNPQSGPLAKIVSVSPIFVNFTMKSGEYIKLRKLDNSADLKNLTIKLQLADGKMYEEEGIVEFIDNEINQTTGTIAVRATFENADGLLVPGDYVKVHVKAKNPRTVMLVPQASVLDDSQGYYVWSVDENNQVFRKDIKVSDEYDKKWIVEEGLTPEDKYVFKGVQSIMYPKQVVKPEELEVEKAEGQPVEQTQQEEQQAPVQEEVVEEEIAE